MDYSIALDARCGDPQSTLFLEQIAHEIVDWEELAPYFSLTEADQMAIRQDHSAQYKVQKRAMLSRWIKRNGNKATFSKMKEIFLRADYVNLADKLVEILQDEHSQSPHNAVAAFKLYLKDCYSTNSPTDSDKQNWPPLANTPYIEPELLLVRPDQQKTDVRSIQLSDLFKYEALPNKILLEGTAGSGKTTLLRNVCQEWGKGELLDRMDLLIHLSLADPKVWSAQSLDGLIPHPSAEIRRAVADTIIERRGKRCCFVMDGWEDLPDDVRPYISDLVYGSKPGIALPHCSFIITSRPIASAPLKRSQAFTTVEINGFSSSSVDAYATQYLSQKGKDTTVFITELHDNHHARGLCNLPINAAILLHLFLTIGTGFPTTHTELFKCFILNLLLRHLVAKQGHNSPRLRNFSSLPEKERQLFDQVCRMAHFATFNTRSSSRSNQLLSPDDLEKEGLNDLQETMGLMKVHSQLTCYGYEPYYGFLHSSVQDFLCAIRISQLSPEEQVRDFRQIMESNPTSLVLIFYAGMTKLKNVDNICEYLGQIGKDPPHFETIIPKLCDNLSEAGDSRRLFLAYLHCLYEADRSDLLVKLEFEPSKLLTTYCCVSFFLYRLSMYDMNVLYHSIVDIARLSHPTNILLSIGMCGINDHMIESAVKILINRASLNYRKFNQCVSFGIGLPCNNLTHNGVKSLARLIGAEGIKLTLLDISDNMKTQSSSIFKALVALAESMSSGFMLNIFSMQNSGLTSRHAYHLVLLFSQNIEYINMSGNRLGECIPLLVAAAKWTKTLVFPDIFVTNKELIQVGKTLQSNTYLKDLMICGSPCLELAPFLTLFLTPEAVCTFIRLVASPDSRSVLTHLYIPDCYVNAIIENSQVLSALKQFALRRRYRLNIMRFSDALDISRPGLNREYWEREKNVSIPDSLLYGTN